MTLVIYVDQWPITKTTKQSFSCVVKWWTGFRIIVCFFLKLIHRLFVWHIPLFCGSVPHSRCLCLLLFPKMKEISANTLEWSAAAGQRPRVSLSVNRICMCLPSSELRFTRMYMCFMHGVLMFAVEKERYLSFSLINLLLVYMCCHFSFCLFWFDFE